MKPARDGGKAIVREKAMTPDQTYAATSPIIGSHHANGNSGHAPLFPSVKKAKLKYGTAGSSHWSMFWRDFGVENRPLERCFIPGDGQHVVDRHWAKLADDLPKAARVIDLGCGAGILGRNLLTHRSDLLVTGVDFAQVPVTQLANLTIHPWVSMEELPFEDGAFDAAISLFGIEYGNMEETARELGRVLLPGACFSFLVHHQESEIVREGSMRLKGLRELLSGKLKAAFLAGRISDFDQQQQRLRIQFPNEPSVKLFSDHFRRNITRTRAERQGIWQKLANDLEPEITLTMHMERSAKSASQLGNWLVPLLSMMTAASVSTLRRNSGEPIAWHVSGIN
jgi:SAM-dependent methyltransferase